jgi:hypothetical protein
VTRRRGDPSDTELENLRALVEDECESDDEFAAEMAAVPVGPPSDRWDALMDVCDRLFPEKRFGFRAVAGLVEAARAALKTPSDESVGNLFAALDRIDATARRRAELCAGRAARQPAVPDVSDLPINSVSRADAPSIGQANAEAFFARLAASPELVAASVEEVAAASLHMMEVDARGRGRELTREDVERAVRQSEDLGCAMVALWKSRQEQATFKPS